jgi:ribose transport system substrate-binding protein
MTVLFACSSPSSKKEESSSAPGEKVFTIGMSQCNLGEPWRVQMNSDIETAAREHPELRVIFKDAQNQTTMQQNHVREFVSQGVDLIIVSPLEAAPLTGPIAEAYQGGIPVIVLDREVLGDQYTLFIGADNVRIGEAAGRWIHERLGGKGKVVELKGLMTSTPGQDRNSGFRKGIEGSAIEVIFEADMRWLQPNAQSEMESALTRFAEIDLVYAHNDPGAYGAYLAARAAGREKDIVFVGIDGLPQEGLAYVEQGILDASFEYPTGGREAVQHALAILKGEETPKRLVLPSRFYTRDNLAQGGTLLE